MNPPIHSVICSIYFLFVCLFVFAGPGCGGVVFNTMGIVTSWKYPGNSSRASDCRWQLAVPLGYHIAIEFDGQRLYQLN